MTDYTYAMETFSGGAFDFSAPSADVIDIYDSAHALGNICRFGGHCSRFYSVAEHSVLVSLLGPDLPYELKMMLLLHDVAEAYLGDIPRPRRLLLPDYNETEEIVRGMVYNKYVGRQPTDKEELIIQDYDDKLLVEEGRRMLHFGPAWEPFHKAPRAGCELKFWTPVEAEREFLDRFEFLNGRLEK